MFAASFVSLLTLAVAISATPAVKVTKSSVNLPISRRLNLTSIHNLYESDLSRARYLMGSPGGKKSKVDTPATNQIGFYVANIGVGASGQSTNYQVLIDTGSSNTWVGGVTPFTETDTSVDTGNLMSVTYGSGFFSGEEFLDRVSFNGLVIDKQQIGVSTNTFGLPGIDGILGLGPSGLSKNTISVNGQLNGQVVPTVTDNLYHQGKIPTNQVAISFEPTTTQAITNGEITWGDVDKSKFIGEIKYSAVTKVYPSSRYWGIDQSITYGSAAVPILPKSAGLVDTGTTLMLIDDVAAQKYQAATGATIDKTTQLLKITSADFAKLQSLFFHIGDATFEFTANAQIFPRSLNTAIGGTADSIYLVVASLGPGGSTAGLQFVNGYSWLERHYTVYSTDKKGHRSVGIAATAHSKDTTN